MNDTPTPETDAEHAQFPMGGFTLDFARKLERELTAVTEQRDRLAVVVQGIRSGYGGQIPDPTCDCGDCEFLIKIDNALQYITKQKEL